MEGNQKLMIFCVTNYYRKIIIITKFIELGVIIELDGNDVSINNKSIILSFNKIKSNSLFFITKKPKFESLNV